MNMKVLRSLFFTLFIFGLLGWIYIAFNAVFHPWTLPLPLTHLAPWPGARTPSAPKLSRFYGVVLLLESFAKAKIVAGLDKP